MPAHVSAAYDTNINALCSALLEDHRGHRLRADGGGHSGVPARLLRHLRPLAAHQQGQVQEGLRPKGRPQRRPRPSPILHQEESSHHRLLQQDRQGSQLHVVEGRDPKGHGGERGGSRGNVKYIFERP